MFLVSSVSEHFPQKQNMLEINVMNIYIHIKENSVNLNMIYAWITYTETTLPISYGLFDNKPQKFIDLFTFSE
jgi:hypothetical protein